MLKNKTLALPKLITVLLVTVGLMAATLTPIEAAPDKPTLLGLASKGNDADVEQFANEAGRPPAIFQLFWGLDLTWPNAWAPAMLTRLEDLGVTAYVEITTTDLDALNSGGQDDDLQGMAGTIGDWLKASPDRQILIAPLPEMNLTHDWGGDPNGYKAGYQRIRDTFLAEGLGPDQIRFVFAPNGTSDVGEYDDYYPGDSIVDLIGFAKINRGDPWRDYDVTFQMHIDELRSRISLAKPILITQTASVDDNGDRNAWLNDMFTGLKAHDQVIGAIYFNRDKSPYDFRVLVNGNLDPIFESGYADWSSPDEVDWIFDGRMDAWVEDREETYTAGFTDIQGHIFQNSIVWLAEQEITTGCNPPANTLFCPDDIVNRGQMAVFLARAKNYPTPSGDHFIDDAGDFYESAANRLFEADITNGCAEARYCGGDRMTRGQMAAFLARIEKLPAPSTDYFVDDDGSTFETAINKIASASITVGCNPPANDEYCPNDFVTRGQMATFLKRALTG